MWLDKPTRLRGLKGIAELRISDREVFTQEGDLVSLIARLIAEHMGSPLNATFSGRGGVGIGWIERGPHRTSVTCWTESNRSLNLSTEKMQTCRTLYYRALTRHHADMDNDPAKMAWLDADVTYDGITAPRLTHMLSRALARHEEPDDDIMRIAHDMTEVGIERDCDILIRADTVYQNGVPDRIHVMAIIGESGFVGADVYDLIERYTGDQTIDNEKEMTRAVGHLHQALRDHLSSAICREPMLVPFCHLEDRAWRSFLPKLLTCDEVMNLVTWGDRHGTPSMKNQPSLN